MVDKAVATDTSAQFVALNKATTETKNYLGLERFDSLKTTSVMMSYLRKTIESS